MATASWYHRDISRVHAEDLLARAGRDGSFLVRDSESVPEAYALCLLFQCHVHTYRILPDADGLLAVQTTQGVQVNCFRTLEDLVIGYQQPHKGLVTPLVYPVPRDADTGDESSDDERIPQSQHAPVNTVTFTTPLAKPDLHALFLDKLQELNTSTTASDVIGLLNDYLFRELPLDIENVHKGATTLCHLKRTLGAACRGLNSEIDLTLSSLETLAKVFDHPSCSLSHANSQGPEMEMDALLCKISALVSLLSTLEKKVLKALQDAVTNHNLAAQPNPPPPEPTPVVTNSAKFHGRSHQPVHSFQVKMLRYGRQTVSVDLDAGVLLFDRKANSFDAERVSHDRVLQVVKYHSSPTKVRVVIDSHNNAPREMIFESTRKGNAFCQLLQLMKTRHSKMSEPDVISVFVGTWNMGSSPPPRNLQSWVTCCGLGHTPDESTASLPHDIYALGTQENPQGEREWVEHIKATLRSHTQIDFKQVAVQSLWNMRLAVFVKPEHESRIGHVSAASVKTGLGNTLGNKGAVGVSFHFGGTSFGFVNCHLTSGSEKVLRRNQNFVDILRLLSLGDKQLGAFDISLRFTHLFWCGDLNYRLDLDVQEILKHVSKRQFEELTCADQLTRERHKRKGFLYFKEEKIAFPPTYRYERGSRDCYLWQKYKTSGVRVNVPSWCDRILWKSYPETHVMCTAYGCTDDIFTSDHSPVFATFQVGVTSHFSSKADPGSGVEKAWVELEGIEAIVKTASKEKFFIDFSSTCLQETRRSSDNDSQSCDVPGFLKLAWSFQQLPKLLPHRSDMAYLQDQHLLLSVKSCDGFESYGECCVALRSLFGASEQFETFLSHHGEEIGSIRGRVRIHVPKDRRGTCEKTYECFRFDKDDRQGHVSPASTRVQINRPLAATPKPTASSYTNPAYFIFEGVSVVRGIEEALPQPRDPQVIWAGNEALQLPKISGRHVFNTNPFRRSDFTEIEIPTVLPQYAAPCQLQTHQPNSSYELFPAKKPSPISPPSSKSISQCPEHLAKPKYHAKNFCQDSILPEKNLRNLYINQSTITRQKARRDLPERTDTIRKTKAPPVFQLTPFPAPLGHCRPAPWVVEPQQHQQQPPGPTGDNSLTALQIAKSLSEVDFFPSKLGAPSYLSQRPAYRNGPLLHTERHHIWENEASVLQGAPETVRELLSALGLQKYSLGLSLNGWDDLDYFSGITEDDLRAAGVTNSSHRRRILENLPRNWN
ncbi:inositol polyphosphate phosphatase-like 1b [Syngnathoides biaculeatus]|uniref:inositol polyphosphate phosphatase-like 1b n=1 Tax=Syngnathoides biaculeatus TaxID=300417 RepID=UPI002ADD42D1|nr:inositol polyphosphate phosphatase-like 1b [Syngnathoides biaculeatus]XP_061691994.1 inositol polyphosphate phosphatase-like 1b [Syngnathoides biaculeatus]